MLLYVVTITFISYKTHFWDFSLLKDTIYWFASAFVLWINYKNATENDRYFADLVKSNLKAIILIEFIVNVYAFSLIIELMLVPILVLLGGISAATQTKSEYLPVKRIIDFILTLFSIYLILFVIYRTFNDWETLATIGNLHAILLPPIFTLAFIPFLYCFALVMAYQEFFICVDVIMKSNRPLARYTKRMIFNISRFNLRRLIQLRRTISGKLVHANSESEVKEIIKYNRNSMAAVSGK